MRYHQVVFISVLLVLFLHHLSIAGTITHWYGDKDAFWYGEPDSSGVGTGIIENQVFYYDDLKGPPQGTLLENLVEGVTDTWLTRNFQRSIHWDHDYSNLLPKDADITGIELEIFTGGLGAVELSSVFVDGVEIGELSDGQISGQMYARKDIFDLTGKIDYGKIIDGLITVEVRTPPLPDNKIDIWALDYSKLAITYSESEPASVPEPSSMILFGFGVLAFMFFQNERRMVQG